MAAIKKHQRDLKYQDMTPSEKADVDAKKKATAEKSKKTREDNKRKAEEEDQVTNVGSSSKPGQKKPRGGVIAAHGKSSLNQVISKETTKSVKKKRNFKEEAILTKSMQGSYGVRTFNAGTIKGNASPPYKDDTCKIIEDLTRIVNVVHIHVQKASLFLIESIMAGPVEHHFLLQSMVSNGKTNDGGLEFWRAFSRLIATGSSGSQIPIITHFKTLTEWKSFVVDSSQILPYTGLSTLLDNNAPILASSFRGQIVGRISLLIGKIFERSVDLEATENEIEDILRDAVSNLENQTMDQYSAPVNTPENMTIYNQFAQGMFT